MGTQRDVAVSHNSSTAPGQALGYLAQVDYALLLLLLRTDTGDDLAVSLELIDDVAFHSGTATDLIQSKHHIDRHGSLADTSTDVWKSIGNWINHAGDAGELVLLSTTVAPTDSAMSKLRPGEDRSVPEALIALERVSREASGETNRKHYSAFIALPPEKRKSLVERIRVADGVVNASEVTTQLTKCARRSVVPTRQMALVERLRGWWHGRVMQHLQAVARHESDYILIDEVLGRLLEIAQTLRDDDLPFDFWDLPEPTPAEQEAAGTRIFVEQLKLIALGNQRLRQCIYDHNRAYLQRSKWQREKLLRIGELATYDKRIQDEWRRHFTPLTDESVPDQSEEEKCRVAREKFDRLDTSPLPAIRPRTEPGYVANGSLHILADRLKIGWHPDWISHLRSRIAEVEDEIESVVA